MNVVRLMLLIFYDISFNSRMFTLTENKITGLWEDKEICFGDAKYCTNELSGEFERYILSFGEDEGGIIIHFIQFYIACSRLSVSAGGRSKKRAGDKRDQLRAGSFSTRPRSSPAPFFNRPH